MHRWTRTYTSARSSEILLKGFFFFLIDLILIIIIIVGAQGPRKASLSC